MALYKMREKYNKPGLRRNIVSGTKRHGDTERKRQTHREGQSKGAEARPPSHRS